MSLEIILKEWETKIISYSEFPFKDSKEIVKTLNEKGILEILELKEQVLIKSNSYIGMVRLGDLSIKVNPKIKGIHLYKLLRYAYGFKDLKLLNTAEHFIENMEFFDLIIYELYIEVEDLLYKGIEKNYVLKEDDLLSPRGKIDINKISFSGGLIKDKLPCKFFNREENTILNEILLAGLKLSLKLVIDSNLKVKIQRLCSYLEEKIEDINLTRFNLQLAKNSINRLNRRYYTILEIINLLFESQGIQFEEGEKRVSLRGYFFDMNAFFEVLVGRLLENIGKDYVIKSQISLRGIFIYSPGFNPCYKKPPTPRPDFAFLKDGEVIKLLDAKYRDLWEKSLPREMLYQLAIYAISGIGDKTATILYPSIDNNSSVQKIDINDPVYGSKLATIILQPLNLIEITDLLTNRENKLREYISEIINV